MSEDEKINLYTLTKSELTEFVVGLGQPAYRASQLWTWMYKKLARDFDSMTNLPVAFRARLDERARLGGMAPVAEMRSTDGYTQKWLLELPDRERIEAVLMEYGVRNTACISVQVGCAYACVFCATGRMGLIRNLNAGEIVEQIVDIERALRDNGEPPAPGATSDDHRLTNIVFMGMGEPFHNYENVMMAIDRLNDADGFKVGARRMTISTVGLVPQIKRFADEMRQVNLAVSLHAADDEERLTIMPINKKYKIRDVIEACKYYIEKTRRRVTFEWALIEGVNDSPEAAKRLASRLKGLLCHVNVIPLNPTHGYHGGASNGARAQTFKQTLEKEGIPCTIRMRRGVDINAGCGQLAAYTGQEM